MLSGRLMEEEKKRLLTREPSKRQQAKWIDWLELMKRATNRRCNPKYFMQCAPKSL